MLKKGETHQGEVFGFAASGEGLIRVGKIHVRVPFVYPGDQVRFKITQSSSKQTLGRYLEILEPAEHRVLPKCAHATTCGGCPWMGFDVPAQNAAKKKQLQKVIFDSLGFRSPDLIAPDSIAPDSITSEPPPNIAVAWTSSEPFHYRRRGRLQWKSRLNSKPILGFLGHRKNEIVSIQECHVLVPKLWEGVRKIQEKVLPALTGQGELKIALGENGRCAAELTTSKVQLEHVYRVFEDICMDPLFSGISLQVLGFGTPSLWGDTRECFRSADGEDVWGVPGGFMQANDAINREMSKVVVDFAAPKDQTVLELYAGIGNWTVHLAREARKTIAVESYEPSRKAFEENLNARGLDANFNAKSVEHFSHRHRIDVLVLDPPREGATEVFEQMMTWRPERVVYISCHLGSLARDLKQFSQLGWIPTQAHGFDMFPQTPHFESIVLLEKK